ncbi:MAG TPA: chromate resistance protein ChrB domain-containing protein, partial [Blastocatellia bacterium]|nr:chromate resistance protein ChrB domain-containing protein [Blastocatellia bacterium]
EDATDEEIVSAFREARDEEYTQVTADLDGLTGAINEQKRGGHLSATRITAYEAELDRLHKELERVILIDFFDAPGRRTAVTAYERCRAALKATQSRSERLAKARSTKTAALDLTKYQGQRWVTRRNLFIDRLASIWLIKRFIDKRPRFHFVSEGETVEGAIRFDMYGAEFTHQGDSCTFETMLNLFGLGDDAGLQAVAEIVHDIDLKDNKFNRLEAPGLSAVIRGLADTLKGDRKLIQQCNPIFDGLYESFSRETEQRVKGKPRERQTRNRPGSGSKRTRRE